MRSPSDISLPPPMSLASCVSPNIRLLTPMELHRVWKLKGLQVSCNEPMFTYNVKLRSMVNATLNCGLQEATAVWSESQLGAHSWVLALLPIIRLKTLHKPPFLSELRLPSSIMRDRTRCFLRILFILCLPAPGFRVRSVELQHWPPLEPPG